MCIVLCICQCVANRQFQMCYNMQLAQPYSEWIFCYGFLQYDERKISVKIEPQQFALGLGLKVEGFQHRTKNNIQQERAGVEGKTKPTSLICEQRETVAIKLREIGMDVCRRREHFAHRNRFEQQRAKKNTIKAVNKWTLFV